MQSTCAARGRVALAAVPVPAAARQHAHRHATAAAECKTVRFHGGGWRSPRRRHTTGPRRRADGGGGGSSRQPPAQRARRPERAAAGGPAVAGYSAARGGGAAAGAAAAPVGRRRRADGRVRPPRRGQQPARPPDAARHAAARPSGPARAAAGWGALSCPLLPASTRAHAFHPPPTPAPPPSCEPGRRLRVAVLISGGVDSSVALQLVRAAGHDAVAFYLQVRCRARPALVTAPLSSRQPWLEVSRLASAPPPPPHSQEGLPPPPLHPHAPLPPSPQIWFQEDFRNFWDACPWEEDLTYARQVPGGQGAAGPRGLARRWRGVGAATSAGGAG